MNAKRWIAVSVLIGILCSLTGLVSCTRQKSKFTSYSLEYFDTATTITGYETTQADFDAVSGEIFALLADYHRLYTIYHRYDGMENLCTINELKDGEHRVVTVDRRIMDMLLYAKEMYRVTDGKLNVAMGSVLSIWHDYRTVGMNEPWQAEIPPMDMLVAAAEHTNIDDLILDPENSTVWIADPKMTLDVGAVAKGYAVEMIARSLEERGISGYVINVGGNVRTIGSKPNGEKWIAGIENPDTESENAYLAYLQLSGESVVTSGSYQRFYVVGDKNYHHIIDPDTLMPAEGFLSVSVVCGSSAEGDSLSTALFCMSIEEGLRLVESLPDVEAHWVLSDGSIYSSDGFSAYVTHLNG